MFKQFAQAVNTKFNGMTRPNRTVFVVDLDKDALYQAYLAAFPPGTNEIYKTNTEHDCTCCKQFIRGVGDVVTINDGVVDTIWNVGELPAPYDVVARALHDFVKSHTVVSKWYSPMPHYGAETSHQNLEEGGVKAWHHFWCKVPNHLYKPGDTASLMGASRTATAVFARALTELKPEAVLDVLELIKNNTLYRGAEHKASVEAFKAAQDKCKNLQIPVNLYALQYSEGPWLTHFRNSAIGTLVTDLSDGMDIEDAVKSFESKVAPQNYKRTTALVTPKMVENAMKFLGDNGLLESIERRHAMLKDISVNNVLWVNSTAGRSMKGFDLAAELHKAVASNAATVSGTKMVTIADFVKDVLPTATDMAVFVKNAHQGNFMSLTTAVHGEAKNLFKWNNTFAWTYDGDVTDGIKERVKRAGGKVDAPLRFSLGWYNYDDLDLHVDTPQGHHIDFRNKMGVLDVDMNAGSGTTRQPVENAAFTHPTDGGYKVMVHNFNKRESVDVGFELEVQDASGVRNYTYAFAVKDRELLNALYVNYTNGVAMVRTMPGLKEGTASQVKWDVSTESFTKVQTMLYSPNFWDGNSIGNQHYFFILAGCKNPNPVRGIYSEYLSNDMQEHRKVFELIGDKTKAPVVDADLQLSGVGFSSTRKDTVMVRVVNRDGKTIVYDVVF